MEQSFKDFAELAASEIAQWWRSRQPENTSGGTLGVRIGDVTQASVRLTASDGESESSMSVTVSHIAD